MYRLMFSRISCSPVPCLSSARTLPRRSSLRLCLSACSIASSRYQRSTSACRRMHSSAGLRAKSRCSCACCAGFSLTGSCDRPVAVNVCRAYRQLNEWPHLLWLTCHLFLVFRVSFNLCNNCSRTKTSH